MKIINYKLLAAVMALLCVSQNAHMAGVKAGAVSSAAVSAPYEAPESFAVAEKNVFEPYATSGGKWKVGCTWSCEWDWFGEWKTDIPGYFLFEYIPADVKVDSTNGTKLQDNGRFESYWAPAPLPANTIPHGIGFSSTLPNIGTVSTSGPKLPLLLVLNSVGLSAGGGYNGKGNRDPGILRHQPPLIASEALPPFGTIRANVAASNTFPGLDSRYHWGPRPPKTMPANCFKMAEPKSNSMYLVELNQIENTLQVWAKPLGAARSAYEPVIIDPAAQGMISDSMAACETPAQYFTFVADTIMTYGLWANGNGSASQAWPIQYSVSQVQSLVSGSTVASKAPDLLVCPVGSFFLHRVGGTTGSFLRAPSWFDNWATAVPGNFEFSFDTDLNHDIMVGFSPTKLSGAAAATVPLVLKIGINNNQHGCVLFNMSPCESADEVGRSTEFPARIPTDLYGQSGNLTQAISIKVVLKQSAPNVNGTKGILSVWAKKPGAPDASYIQIFDGDIEPTIAAMIAEAPANLKYFSLTKGNDQAMDVKDGFFTNVVIKVPNAPAADKPAVEKPADKPAVEKPADKPAVEKPAVKPGYLRKKKRGKGKKNKKSSIDTPANPEQPDEKPADKKTTDEKPADKKTTDEKPAEKKAAKEKNSSVRKNNKKAAAKKAAAKKAAAKKAAAKKAAAKKADDKKADDKKADDKKADEAAK